VQHGRTHGARKRAWVPGSSCAAANVASASAPAAPPSAAACASAASAAASMPQSSAAACAPTAAATSTSGSGSATQRCRNFRRVVSTHAAAAAAAAADAPAPPPSGPAPASAPDAAASATGGRSTAARRGQATSGIRMQSAFRASSRPGATPSAPPAALPAASVVKAHSFKGAPRRGQLPRGSRRRRVNAQRSERPRGAAVGASRAACCPCLHQGRDKGRPPELRQGHKGWAGGMGSSWQRVATVKRHPGSHGSPPAGIHSPHLALATGRAAARPPGTRSAR
jgi:hypothetical protein